MLRHLMILVLFLFLTGTRCEKCEFLKNREEFHIKSPVVKCYNNYRRLTCLPSHKLELLLRKNSQLSFNIQRSPVQYDFHQSQISQNRTLNEYHCVLMEEYRSKRDLYSTSKEIVFDHKPKSQTLLEGHPADFICSVLSTELLNIIWYVIDWSSHLNGNISSQYINDRSNWKLVKSDFNYQIEKFDKSDGNGIESILTIQNVSMRNNGHYVCEAISKSEKENVTFQLIVENPPRISHALRNVAALIPSYSSNKYSLDKISLNTKNSDSTTIIDVIENDPILLICQVTGNPKISINWFEIVYDENNQPSQTIINNDRQDIEQTRLGNLFFRKITKLFQNNIYVCVSANEHGKFSRKIQISVHSILDVRIDRTSKNQVQQLERKHFPNGAPKSVIKNLYLGKEVGENSVELFWIQNDKIEIDKIQERYEFFIYSPQLTSGQWTKIEMQQRNKFQLKREKVVKVSINQMIWENKQMKIIFDAKNLLPNTVYQVSMMDKQNKLTYISSAIRMPFYFERQIEKFSLKNISTIDSLDSVRSVGWKLNVRTKFSNLFKLTSSDEMVDDGSLVAGGELASRLIKSSVNLKPGLHPFWVPGKLKTLPTVVLTEENGSKLLSIDYLINGLEASNHYSMNLQFFSSRLENASFGCREVELNNLYTADIDIGNDAMSMKLRNVMRKLIPQHIIYEIINGSTLIIEWKEPISVMSLLGTNKRGNIEETTSLMGRFLGYRVLLQTNESDFEVNTRINSTTQAVIVSLLQSDYRYCIVVASIWQSPIISSKKMDIRLNMGKTKENEELSEYYSLPVCFTMNSHLALLEGKMHMKENAQFNDVSNKQLLKMEFPQHFQIDYVYDEEREKELEEKILNDDKMINDNLNVYYDYNYPETDTILPNNLRPISSKKNETKKIDKMSNESAFFYSFFSSWHTITICIIVVAATILSILFICFCCHVRRVVNRRRWRQKQNSQKMNSSNSNSGTKEKKYQKKSDEEINLFSSYSGNNCNNANNSLECSDNIFDTNPSHRFPPINFSQNKCADCQPYITTTSSSSHRQRLKKEPSLWEEIFSCFSFVSSSSSAGSSKKATITSLLSPNYERNDPNDYFDDNLQMNGCQRKRTIPNDEAYHDCHFQPAYHFDENVNFHKQMNMQNNNLQVVNSLNYDDNLNTTYDNNHHHRHHQQQQQQQSHRHNHHPFTSHSQQPSQQQQQQQPITSNQFNQQNNFLNNFSDSQQQQQQRQFDNPLIDNDNSTAYSQQNSTSNEDSSGVEGLEPIVNCKNFYYVHGQSVNNSTNQNNQNGQLFPSTNHLPYPHYIDTSLIHFQQQQQQQQQNPSHQLIHNMTVHPDSNNLLLLPVQSANVLPISQVNHHPQQQQQQFTVEQRKLNEKDISRYPSYPNIRTDKALYEKINYSNNNNNNNNNIDPNCIIRDDQRYTLLASYPPDLLHGSHNVTQISSQIEDDRHRSLTQLNKKKSSQDSGTYLLSSDDSKHRSILNVNPDERTHSNNQSTTTTKTSTTSLDENLSRNNSLKAQRLYDDRIRILNKSLTTTKFSVEPKRKNKRKSSNSNKLNRQQINQRKSPESSKKCPTKNRLTKTRRSKTSSISGERQNLQTKKFNSESSEIKLKDSSTKDSLKNDDNSIYAEVNLEMQIDAIEQSINEALKNEESSNWESKEFLV